MSCRHTLCLCFGGRGHFVRSEDVWQAQKGPVELASRLLLLEKHDWDRRRNDSTGISTKKRKESSGRERDEMRGMFACREQQPLHMRAGLLAAAAH